jgi:predicted Ser/Thr protein kinase
MDKNQHHIMPPHSTKEHSGSRHSNQPFELTAKRSNGATKAQVRIEQRGDKTVLIKDFRNSNPIIKIYGRYTLYREARAYSKLAGLKGFPFCHGREGRDVLVLEYIPGRSLSSFKRGTVPESTFDKLDTIVKLMHSRGVVNCDLHRSNVLLSQHDVFIIDFASAFIFSNPQSPGRIARAMMQLDIHAAAKIRARYMRKKKPLPPGFFGFFYRIIKYLKSRLRKLKKTF